MGGRERVKESLGERVGRVDAGCWMEGGRVIGCEGIGFEGSVWGTGRIA